MRFGCPKLRDEIAKCRADILDKCLMPTRSPINLTLSWRCSGRSSGRWRHSPIRGALINSELDELSSLGAATAFAGTIERQGLTPLDVYLFPMPAHFKQLFRHWAEGRIKLVRFLGEESS